MGSVFETLANYNPTGFALENQQRQANVGQTQAQTGLTQQATQGEALKNQAMQVQLRDQQLLGDAFRESAGDPNKTAMLAVQNGISPNGFINFRNQHTEYLKQLSGLKKDDLANEAATNQQVGAIYGTLSQLQGQDRAAAIPDALNRLKQIDPTHPLPDAQSLMDDKALQTKIGFANYADTLIKQQGDRAKVGETLANTTKAQRDAELAAAKTPGEQAQSAITSAEADAVQNAMKNPQGLLDQVDGLNLDKASAMRTKSMVQFSLARGDYKGAVAAINNASAKQAEVDADIAKATNPQIRAAEVQKAVDVARQTAPIEIGKSIATAKALRMGDNPAVAGVAPAAVGHVQDSATKLDEEYVKAKSVTDSMGKILDLAASGNKAAGSSLPLVGVETLNAINGIKRVNSSEIAQYGSAGSLLDEIKGKLGKLTVGQPVPKDVMDDIRELHQELGQQAYQVYTGSLNSLNKRSGSKFEPIVEAPNIRKAPAAAAPAASGAGIAVPAPNGKTYHFKSQADADAFRKSAGIQ